MAIINRMVKKIDNDISNLKSGLQPENLSFWYSKIINETIEMAPPWLEDKIKVHQDPILIPSVLLINTSQDKLKASTSHNNVD